MTKKFFISFTTMLLCLFVGVGNAWAEMTPAEAETNGYWARLTARPATATNGSGKVYVGDSSTEPDAGEYETVSSSKDGYTEIFIMSSAFSTNAEFYTFAKADDGSYFTGWSFTDGYTDLGMGAGSLHVSVAPSSHKGHSNYREHVIYAAFEPIQLVSYNVTGNNTTVAQKCTLTVNVRAEMPGVLIPGGRTENVVHFNNPSITPKAGSTGTWTSVATSDINRGDVTRVYSDRIDFAFKVIFTAPNADAGEYAATLTFSTKAGVSISVPLYARTVIAGDEAIRYNKSKEQQETGSLATLLANAAADDIIKLNGDYSQAVEINKNVTFDLNGFALSNTLTVSGGNVTLAYSPYGGSVNAVNVTGGKAILNGCTIGALTVGAGGTVEQNGAAIGGVSNSGTLTTTDGVINGSLASSGTLTINGGTFTNNSGVAITVNGGVATINRGSISGSTYGVETTGGTTSIEKLAAVSGDTKALYGNGGSLTVNNGKFTDPANLIAGSVTFNAGYFKTNTAGGSLVLGKQVWRNTAGVEYREGYEFFVGDQAVAQASNVSVCRIGATSYSSLEDALAYANNTTKEIFIIMENDYTLPAGYYTLPANATLIVPMSNDQEVGNAIVPRSTSAVVVPEVFRTLTFADGVNLNVLGTLEVTCTQYGSGTNQAIPGGPYGHLILKPGSRVTLSNGSELRAWGYVTGDGTRDANGTYLSGEIDARRGSIVREMFQMGDWKGGDISLTMIAPETSPQNKMGLFPVYMYFIQNIESPVKYHPGSSLICATSVNIAGSINAYANEIKVVGVEGEAAMFLMNQMADAENTWVRKWYDVKNDTQVYEVNSAAQLGSMVIDLGNMPGGIVDGFSGGEIKLDSRKFVLPLTSNMKIHLLSGLLQFTQSTSLLPGMEVEVDKESTVMIINQDRPEVVEGALYLYDTDQWGAYVMSGRYGALVNYSATLKAKPSARSVSSAAALGDAKLNVHGTFRMGENCSVFTTWSKSGYAINEGGTGGASIVSTNEDAGTFIFDAEAPAFQGFTWGGSEGDVENLTSVGLNALIHYDNSTGWDIPTVLHPETRTRMFGFQLCTSAKLKNSDGSFVSTEGTLEGKSYCFIDDKWTCMEADGCFFVDAQDNVYAKPAEYVQLATTKGVYAANEDHTYSDAAGTGRLFILMGNSCQWWEVEKEDNLYHCIHPDNDTYYYWDETEGDWVEKRFTITWKNWDGTPIETVIDEYGHTGSEYSVTYGTMAEFLGSNPTRDENIDYTYDFTGWSPELGRVTSDVTYTATYVEKPRKYTVIFQTEGGVEIEHQFLTHNEVPVCENVPTRTGFTLEWSPAIAAVIGNATYTATWLEEPPTEYEVTFFDYDGTTELQKGNVTVGTMPVYTEATPSGKPATSEFTYEFDHWSPALEEVSVTSIKSYTAVYREVAKTYTISYFKEDGVTPNPTKSSESLTYGATPTPPAVTKENPVEGHTYTLVWKTLDESATVANVTGDASYKPTYLDVINRYTVTLKSNLSGVCTFTGAGTFDYGTDVTIAVTPNSGYEFVKWQETGNTSANLGSQNITEDIKLTAILKESALPDPEDLNVGIDATETVSAATNYMDVSISSDGVAHSSQIFNADNIMLYGNADFTLAKSMDKLHWYDIAVPWRVDANGGIFLNGGSTPAVLGTDIDIYYYDGAVRAAQGKVDACWVPVKNQTKKVLEPGRAYLFILYKAPASAVTFRKKVQEPILTTSTSVTPHASANAIDAGWNGIANPSLYHAYINAGAAEESGHVYGQMINAAGDGYEPYDMKSHKLVVGQPIYVQAPAAKNIVANSGSYSAPVRHIAAQSGAVNYNLTITAEGANTHADRIIIQMNEDKEEDGYVIGQDLAKFGMGAKVAQWWIERYGTKLCVNTVAPKNDMAEYPLTIVAPKAGEYTIAIDCEADAAEYALYLTYDGEAIANLSEGAYTATIQKGTNVHYGLRISPKAPQVTTGIDEAIVNAQGETRKVLIGNQVFIIRGEKVYNVDGQLVK